MTARNFLQAPPILRRLYRRLPHLLPKKLKPKTRFLTLILILPLTTLLTLILIYLSIHPTLLFPDPDVTFAKTHNLFGTPAKYFTPDGKPLDVMTRVHAARGWWEARVGNGRGGKRRELWDEVKERTCVVIKTGHEVALGRLSKLLRRGWLSVGRDVPNLVAIGDGWDGRVGVVGMREYGMAILEGRIVSGNGSVIDKSVPGRWFGRGGWRGDKDKNLPGFHLARTLWPKCEWFVMVDDDTYFLAENFAEWALRREKELKGMGSLYTGKVFYVSSCGGYSKGKDTRGKRNPTFAHGGSGIVVNRKAMDFAYPRIAECIRKYTGCWAGDMQVGLCLKDGGIAPPKYGNRTYEKHFTPFSPGRALMDSRYNQRWKSKEKPISFHKLPDGELEAMSEYERKCREGGKDVVYRELKEWLNRRGIDGKAYTENEKRRTGGAAKSGKGEKGGHK